MSKFIVGTIVNMLIGIAVFLLCNLALGYVGNYLAYAAMSNGVNEATFNFLINAGVLACIGSVITVFGIGRESKTSKE